MNIRWSEFLQQGNLAKEKFPELLKFVMRKADVETQLEMAKILEISAAHLSELKNRKSKPEGPQWRAVQAMAMLLETVPGEVRDVLGIYQSEPHPTTQHTPEINSFRAGQQSESLAARGRKSKIRRASSEQNKE